jgi:hypothetical protein
MTTAWRGVIPSFVVNWSETSDLPNFFMFSTLSVRHAVMKDDIFHKAPVYTKNTPRRIKHSIRSISSGLYAKQYAKNIGF